MWIEVVNEDENFLIGQYRDTVESSPDYHGVKDQEAFLEFRKKVENYKQVAWCCSVYEDTIVNLRFSLRHRYSSLLTRTKSTTRSKPTGPT